MLNKSFPHEDPVEVKYRGNILYLTKLYQV
jgi:hypothetical protein